MPQLRCSPTQRHIEAATQLFGFCVHTSYSHMQCLLPLALPSQRSNSKAPCFHWQKARRVLSHSWLPRLRLVHQPGAGPCMSLNTYTLIHTPTPNPALLAPSLLDRTKKLIGEACSKEMGRLAGNSCCHHGYQLTHFSSTQTGPPSQARQLQAALGKVGALSHHTQKRNSSLRV